MRLVLILKTVIGFSLAASAVAYFFLSTPVATVSTILTSKETQARQREIREKEKLRPDADTAAELLDQQATELAEIKRWHATRPQPAR